MRLAWCTPMADRSAIAAKSELVVGALRLAGVDVDVWFPSTARGRSYVAGQREMVPGCEVALERYDAVVYCIGDHADYHGRILEAAWQVPGIVALHDVSLANLFYGMAVEHGFDWLTNELRRTDSDEDATFVMSELARPHGWPGNPGAAERVPMLASALRTASAVVTHSHFAAGRVAMTYLGDVAVVGLPTVAAPAAAGAPRSYGLVPVPTDRPIVIQAGQLNPNKRTDLVIEAFGKRGLWRRATLAIVGAGTVQTMEDLRRQAHRLDIEHAVRFLGPVDDPTLDELRAASSVAVVLRDPCLEAASAGLLDAFSHGLPCVAVDHGMYGEVTDVAVRRVPAPPTADDVADAITWWLDDPERQARGRVAALDYIDQVCAPRHYADTIVRLVAGQGASRTRQMLVDGIGDLLIGLDLVGHGPTTDRLTARAHELFGSRPNRLPALPTPDDQWVFAERAGTAEPERQAPAVEGPAPLPADVEAAPVASDDTPPASDERPHGLLVSYAQNGEDVVLARGLRHRDGFYVDIGAFHPRDDSVTQLFYLRGWHGINVDPVPEVIALFQRERGRDVNVQAAISTQTGLADMWTGPPDLIGHSTLVTSVADAHASDGVPFSRSVVQTLTLAELLDRNVPAGTVIDFLKVDVEGHEHAVLASGDWTRWRPRVVVVECLAPYIEGSTHVSWEPILVAAGYRLALFDGLNRFYVADGAPDLMETLAAPASVLDQYEKVTVSELQDHARHLAHAYDSANHRTQALERRVAWLEQRLRYVGVSPDDPGLGGRP